MLELVKAYWEKNPLFSFEFVDIGSDNFFKGADKIKFQEVDRFALKFWEFNGYRKRSVLDVGCGFGWLTVNYALGGANVYAIDLSSKAVELSRRHVEYKNASAIVEEGNVEKMRYNDNFFDLLVAHGVLHHTANVSGALKECFRVLKSGGKAKISFYHKGVLHNKLLFELTKIAMGLLGVKRPGSNFLGAKDSDDFIRRYDGEENPIGLGKTKKEWSKLLYEVGFIIKGSEIHYFPKRFFPIFRNASTFIHFLLDRFLGTIIYFDLKKP